MRSQGLGRKGGWIILAATALLLTVCSSGQKENLAETGLQGQVSMEDQMSGRSQKGYVKNVTVVGHNDVNNRGGNGHLAWIDDCAYFRGGGPGNPDSGLAVLDVKDPAKPTTVKVFPPPTGASDFAVWADQESRLLATIHNSAAASLLRIYDVPADCTQPVPKGTYNFGNDAGKVIVTHEQKVWRDKIYVGTLLNFKAFDPNTGVPAMDGPTPGPAIIVIDASNRDNPTLLTTWDLSDEPGMPESGAHNWSISADGKRVYVAGYAATPDHQGQSGLFTLDTTEVANWKPGSPRPIIRRVGPFVVWTPPIPGASHTAELIKIQGRKYLIVENEGGAVPCPMGYAQLIDAENELGPQPISSFHLEVNERRNCARVAHDLDGAKGLLGLLGYSTHYVGVDNPEEAKLAAFTWYGSGLRIADISDPYNPKEVGYYNAPAVSPKFFAGGGTGSAPFRPDPAYSFVRYYKGNWWYVTIDGGFWVVKYTP